MFIDKVVVHLKAGKGGNGVVAWRREKYIPKGGPSGGNGGMGGSVILKSDPQIFSLDHLRNRRQMRAQNGVQGGPNLRQGKRGEPLVIKVPCGTLVKRADTKELLFDFTEENQVFEVCKGGKGGRGNDSFKTPTRQAPNFCTPGRDGEELEIELELKLIADVGLVGFPNAGKSTLLNTLARGKAKTGAYPFTTLHPHLGFIETPSFQRIYIADIPGIIEGASNAKGLGLEFLRHIERTSLLLFMLDASGIDGRNPTDDFATLQNELKSYSEELLDRPYLIVLNKIDDDASEENIKIFKQKHPAEEPILISAVIGEGVDALKDRLCKKLLPSSSSSF